MANASLTEKTCKYTGKQVWAVEYVNADGRAMRSNWTTIHAEACVWGKIIQQHGYCASARPGPV
jgi:hypothetical protein